jgi:hypothetical protein
VLARRHFGAGTIGLGLFLLGGRQCQRTIRLRLGGLGPPEDRSWRALRRWSDAVVRRRLFGRLAAIPIAARRERAFRAAVILSTYAAPSLASAPAEAQVFSGAERLAHAA